MPLPEERIVRRVPTNPGMNGYVLMSEDTGSVAATFCDPMQYAPAVKLAGEPLLHNAFEHGDAPQAEGLFPPLPPPSRSLYLKMILWLPRRAESRNADSARCGRVPDGRRSPRPVVENDTRR